MFGWLSKRIFSEKTLGYLYKKVQPMIKEDISVMIVEGVKDLLVDEEFLKMMNVIGDGYYARYRRKFFSTIGGLQKGINYSSTEEVPNLDVFDEDGRISLKKVLPQLLSGKLSGFFKGNQAQSGQGSGNGSRNAPEM